MNILGKFFNKKNIKNACFKNRMVILGCGFIGQGVLPLILKHIDIDPKKILIVTSDNRGKDVADYYGVKFIIDPISPSTYKNVLSRYLDGGDFLINLSSDVGTNDLVLFCQEKNILYLDTCIDSWLGESIDATLSVSERSLYTLREEIIETKKRFGNNSKTAVLAHGANPGIVSHLVKQALLNIAKDNNLDFKIPESRDDWAKLSQLLNIKVIHIAERDTQVPFNRKIKNEFINTWSIDGLVGEAVQPAELGWGTHEKDLPEDGGRHLFGSQSAIYINKPGASVKVRTWLPLAGPQIGYLITHNESISIANYLTIGSNDNPEYRPTVHYVYHPCDDAMLSMHEFQEREWVLQDNQRAITNEIVAGLDELGVLMIGNKKGVYWFGSRLDINTARKLAPFNSATSLQVTAGVLAGIVWAIKNPQNGIVEAEDMDFQEVLQIAEPYWGGFVGEYNNWNPVLNRSVLFPEDLDFDDVYQFKNFRVL